MYYLPTMHQTVTQDVETSGSQLWFLSTSTSMCGTKQGYYWGRTVSSKAIMGPLWSRTKMAEPVSTVSGKSFWRDLS